MTLYQQRYEKLMKRCRVLHAHILQLLQRSPHNSPAETLEQDANPDVYERWDWVKQRLDELHEEVTDAESLIDDLEQLHDTLNTIWSDLLILQDQVAAWNQSLVVWYWLEFYALMIEIHALYLWRLDKNQTYENISVLADRFQKKINEINEKNSVYVFPNPVKKGNPLQIEYVYSNERKDLTVWEMIFLRKNLPLLHGNLEEANQDYLKTIADFDMEGLVESYQNNMYLLAHPLFVNVSDAVVQVFNESGAKLWNMVWPKYEWNSSYAYTIAGDVTGNMKSWFNLLFLQDPRNGWFTIPVKIIISD